MDKFRARATVILLCVLVSLLIGRPAHAASTITGNATVAWTAPTDYSDSTPAVPHPLPAGAIQGYYVYVGTATHAYDRVIRVPAGVTTASIPITAAGRIYVAVTALAAVPVDLGTELRESDYSEEVTRGIAVVDVVPPAPPSGVTINIAVTCTPAAPAPGGSAAITCTVKVTQ